ncbi:MAG: serine protease, partial [Candidatus Obscuribacterales bacterium]|nr:serine protease [Candidatus Obscuribacterales bacterium]
HCVDDANELVVMTASGEFLDATVSAYDKDADIAILKVSSGTKNIGPIGPALAMTDESALKPRDQIFALGHPKGDRHTYISPGSYLTSCDRFEIENYFETTIQKATSAPSVRKLGQYCLGDKSLNNKMLAVRADIYHGNSGGPIVNERAEVVGIVGEGADDDPVNGAVPASIIQNMLSRVQADERAHNTAVKARSQAVKQLYRVN